MRNSFLFCLFFCFIACVNRPAPNPDQVQLIPGETMGTYYRISYVGPYFDQLQIGIDSLLFAINQEVSTYEPNSIISRFNTSEKGIDLGPAPHFKANLNASQQVFQQTQGAYDATVMPLVNFWGFGYTPERQQGPVDTVAVNSIRELIGLDKVQLLEDSLEKDLPEIQLDFSACAKGYAVDQVGQYLEQHGITSYLVDIGGDGIAKGKKPDGQIWRVGINVPDEEATLYEIITAFPVHNRAVATSGNYRNWYEVEGVKYSHTINPQTGFPERTELLSASVFHKNCMMADAYATACMVLGVEKALSLAESSPEIEIYLIFSRSDGSMETRYTSGLDTLFNE